MTATIENISEKVQAILASDLPDSAYEERPFANDDEFWELACERMLTRGILNEITRDRARQMFGMAADYFDWNEAVMGALREKDAALDALYRRRAALTEGRTDAPRILRFAQQAGLSELDLELLVYLTYRSLDRRHGSIGTPDIGDFARAADISHKEFFELFNPSMKLVRMGLLHIERDIIGNLNRDLRLELPVLKALRGFTLTRDEQLALGVEALEHLLAEERGSDVVSPVLEDEEHDIEPEPEDDAPDWNLDDDDYDDDDDLDAIERVLAAGHEPDLEAEPQERPRSAFERAGHAASDDEPYRDNLDYIADCENWLFELAMRRKKVVEMRSGDLSIGDRDRNPLTVLRQAEVKTKLARARIDSRLAATRTSGTWVPRAEELQERYELDDFEKNVLVLLACVSVSIEFRQRLEVARYERAEVGELLFLFHDSLEEQLAARRYFRKSSQLVSQSLITLSGRGLGTGFLSQDVEIDRSMAEHILGMDSESALEVEGSHLYWPKVELDRVVLNKVDKDLVVRTVASFPAFREARRRSGLDEIVTYGTGIVLLFYGPSGTGKTMLANALGAHLGQKILLVNFPSLGSGGDEALRFLFREAKVHNAVLFFDECEAIFESRATGSSYVNPLLTELERHDGIVILATNRQFDLDEALHRRITLAIEFHAPDVSQREAIWRAHIPENMQFEGEIDLAYLAYQFELTGGLIKNAVVAALSIAASQNPDDPGVTQAMLEQGARLQSRGRLRMNAFEDRMVPKRSLDDVVVNADVRQELKDIVASEKARRTLVAEWGFSNGSGPETGTSVLFYGAPGTGKTLSAEAVAFELGRPVKRINFARVISMWVGEGAKNIEAIFRDASNHEAVLLFDEADALFTGRTAVRSSTDRYANLDVTILLRELERYPGVVILTTNEEKAIDHAFARRIRFHVKFDNPGAELRRELWKRHIPSRAPLADDVSFDALAPHRLTGAEIRNAVVKAASRAALRMGDERVIRQADLERAAGEESAAANREAVMGFDKGGP